MAPLRLLRSSLVVLSFFNVATTINNCDCEAPPPPPPPPPAEFTRVLQRKCAGGGRGRAFCGVAVRRNFASPAEVAALHSLSARTAEKAQTDAALAVFEFESNCITHGDGFVQFWDKLRPRGNDNEVTDQSRNKSILDLSSLKQFLS